jgi:hypothetical protein
VWLSGDGELRFELATFEASANHPGEAARELAEAVRCGWRALPRVESEPAWVRLRARPEVLAALAPVVGPAG